MFVFIVENAIFLNSHYFFITYFDLFLCMHYRYIIENLHGDGYHR